MAAFILSLAGIALGCVTIVLSVAFSLAASRRDGGNAYLFLMSASAAMALSVAVSIAAGRMM